MTTEQIKELAETQWEGCHGCDENDKYFWINGFIQGYINARVDIIDDKIKSSQDKIADILISGSICEYSGLPSVESYEEEDKTFKQKSKWTTSKKGKAFIKS